MNAAVLQELAIFSVILILVVVAEIFLLHNRFRLERAYSSVINFLFVLAASVGVYSFVIGSIPSFRIIALAVIFFVIFVVLEESWNGFGQALLASVSLSSLSYLSLLVVSFSAHLNDSWLNLLLVALIILFTLAGLVHFVGSTFELCDVLFRTQWQRRRQALTEPTNYLLSRFTCPPTRSHRKWSSRRSTS
jgi:hypothetical protein